MSSLAMLDDIVREFPNEVQMPVRHLVSWWEEKLQIPREDFLRLEHTVERLAEAQERTEQRVEELAAAQARTEQRVEELATAQTRTEQRVDRLEAAVEKLAAAQERTEQRLQELSTAVQGLTGSQKFLADQIAALGSRWGIYNEAAFRATIQGIFSKMEGITVKEGYYGGRQVDVVIQNGEHILLEITSRMHTKDITRLYKSADDYRDKEGIEPKLMVATSYVSPKLMRKIMSLERPIEIFSYEGEE